jgi:glutamate-1-semialdehyde 2,1-aminomutase
MYAMRLARAFTGRERILRMHGSYHGTHDSVCIGEAELHPMPLPGTHGDTAVGWGVPRSLVSTSAFADFNDLESAREVFDRFRGEMAGIIVEPIPGAGGHVAPEPGYLQGLRALCDDHDAVLILDEMITASVGRGGAQGLYGVTPDLTTAGKGMAGGMAIGVVGGREDIMALSESRGTHAPVYISSTFGGHPMVMVAGKVALQHLTPDVYEHMASLGGYMRQGMRAVIDRRGAPMQVTGDRQLIGFHMSETPVRSFTQATGDPADKLRISLHLMTHGFNVPPGRASVTAAHSTSIIDEFLDAFDMALVETKVAR